MITSEQALEVIGLGEWATNWRSLPFRERRTSYRENAEGDGAAPMHLYKYRSVSTDSDINNLKSMVCGNTIWSASVESLNDPFDGRAQYKYKKNTAAEKYLIEQFLRSDMTKRTPAQRIALRQQIQNSFRTDSSLLEVINSAQGMRQKFGVFSASDTPRSLLMWAHYAFNHTGVCVQFAGYNEPLFLGAASVNYSNDFPTIDVPTENGDRGVASLLQKSIEWQYEREWRILNAGVWDTAIQLEPSAVKAIILGARATPDTVALIHDLAEERRRVGISDMSIYHARMSPARYAVGIFRGLPPTNWQGKAR